MAFRPQTLEGYVGQDQAVARLRIALAAAKKRGRAAPHTLISGPAGVGKTSLAQVIANEMGGKAISVIGSQVKTLDDLVSLLAKLNDGDVLFIDEIHGLPKDVEEHLYHPLEDQRIFLDGQWYPTADFTLVGATTKPGALSRPLFDRFRLHLTLKLYDPMVLGAIVYFWMKTHRGVQMSEEAAIAIGRRARGVPRVALALADRVWDWAEANDLDFINLEDVEEVMAMEGVDENGLREEDYDYLLYLARANRPVGIKAIASALNKDADYVEEFMEPWLIHLGLVARTGRGRMLTDHGFNYIAEKLAEKVEC